LDGIDSVDDNRRDPDEEARYLAELKSPVNIVEEKRAFGIRDEDEYDYPDVMLACPPFSIDVPAGAWESGSRPDQAGGTSNQEKMAKQIAYQIVETHIKKAISDQIITIEASKKRGSVQYDYRYKYAIGRFVSFGPPNINFRPEQDFKQREQ
jgi:hypothetical protein